MRCDQLMTREPVCCLPNDNVIKAAQIMKRADIGLIPIIDTEETKMIVGILSDRDMTMNVIAESRDPQTTTVEEVMTRKVVSCQVSDDIQKAMDLMMEYQLRRIPVVDKSNKIVGIISQADVATRLNQPGTTAEVVKEISQPRT